METKNQYGLKVAYRPYRCDCCNQINSIQTNHTATCYSICTNCCWRSAFDSDGNHYRADVGKQRPHYYAGEAVDHSDGAQGTTSKDLTVTWRVGGAKWDNITRVPKGARCKWLQSPMSGRWVLDDLSAVSWEGESLARHDATYYGLPIPGDYVTVYTSNNGD